MPLDVMSGQERWRLVQLCANCLDWRSEMVRAWRKSMGEVAIDPKKVNVSPTLVDTYLMGGTQSDILVWNELEEVTEGMVEEMRSLSSKSTVIECLPFGGCHGVDLDLVGWMRWNCPLEGDTVLAGPSRLEAAIREFELSKWDAKQVRRLSKLFEGIIPTPHSVARMLSWLAEHAHDKYPEWDVRRVPCNGSNRTHAGLCYLVWLMSVHWYASYRDWDSDETVLILRREWFVKSIKVDGKRFDVFRTAPKMGGGGGGGGGGRASRRKTTVLALEYLIRRDVIDRIVRERLNALGLPAIVCDALYKQDAMSMEAIPASTTFWRWATLPIMQMFSNSFLNESVVINTETDEYYVVAGRHSFSTASNEPEQSFAHFVCIGAFKALEPNLRDVSRAWALAVSVRGLDVSPFARLLLNRGQHATIANMMAEANGLVGFDLEGLSGEALVEKVERDMRFALLTLPS